MDNTLCSQYGGHRERYGKWSKDQNDTITAKDGAGPEDRAGTRRGPRSGAERYVEGRGGRGRHEQPNIELGWEARQEGGRRNDGGRHGERQGEPRQRAEQGSDAGRQQAGPGVRELTRRYEDTNHRRKTGAREDRNTSDARLHTQIYRRNSRTYQTAYDHPKTQDHRVTNNYQEGKAKLGNHGTSHGTPSEGRDEEEQKKQGNKQGNVYRGQLTGDPTDQGARTTTREQGRGRGGRGGEVQRTRPARRGDWEEEGTVKLSQRPNTRTINV